MERNALASPPLWCSLIRVTNKINTFLAPNYWPIPTNTPQQWPDTWSAHHIPPHIPHTHHIPMYHHTHHIPMFGATIVGDVEFVELFFESWSKSHFNVRKQTLQICTCIYACMCNSMASTHTPRSWGAKMSTRLSWSCTIFLVMVLKVGDGMGCLTSHCNTATPQHTQQ